MSKELAKTYDPKQIEEKMYEKWCENKYFHAEVDRSKKPFTTVMPPPNITGKLHMGHALDNTLQDILIRYKRMEGYNALWIPGTDHAAISTEVKVTNQLKDEGIDKKLKKAVVCSTSYDELIDSVKSKRYTYNRINRMLLHILVGFTKEMSKSMKEIDYIRILGFNDKGRSYLNKVKKEVNLPILSRFKRNFSPILDFELKTTSIYGLINNDRNLILEEYNNHLGGENNEK